MSERNTDLFGLPVRWLENLGRLARAPFDPTAATVLSFVALCLVATFLARHRISGEVAKVLVLLGTMLLANLTFGRPDVSRLYLSFVPPLEDYVPLFAAIYGGYTTVMGRATPGDVMANPQLFAVCQGEQLLFGGQLGWVSEEILGHPEAAHYLRDLARLRATVRDILHTGTLDAPLATEQNRRIRLVLPATLCAKDPVTLDRPAIRHTAMPRRFRVRLPALAKAAGWNSVTAKNAGGATTPQFPESGPGQGTKS